MAGRPDFSITMGLVGASTVLTGIRSTIDIMGMLIRKVSELAEAADAYGDVVAGHRVSVESANEATSHLVDTMELHRQAARLEAAGLQVTSQQFRALTVAATQYAQATGGDVTESVERLTTAVIGANSRGLRPYGIQLRENGTLQDRQRALIDQLTRAHGAETVAIEGTQDAIESLRNSWGEAWGEMLLTLEHSAGPIGEFLRLVSRQVNDIAAALRTQREASEHLRRMGNEERIRQLQRDIENAGYTRYGNRAPGVLARAVRVGAGLNLGIPHQEYGQSDLDRAMLQASAELGRLEQQDIDRIRAGVDPVVRDVAPAYAPPEGGGGGGGASQRQRDLAMADTTETMFRAMDALYAAQAELEEQRIAKHRSVNEELVRLEEERTQRENEIRARAEQPDDWTDRKIAHHQEWLDALDREIEKTRALADAEHERHRAHRDAVKSWVETSASIYTSITSSVGGLLTSLEQNAEKRKKIEGGIAVALQVGELLKATTLAAMNYAGQNYTQAALYTAAAAVAAVGLAKTIAEFNVQPKSGVSGSSSSARLSGGGRADGGMYGGRQPTIAVYFTGPVTSRRARDEVVALERAGARGY